jgi:hypothetical protein
MKLILILSLLCLFSCSTTSEEVEESRKVYHDGSSIRP